MDTAPYRQALEAEPLDFTEWETGRLKEHIGVLIVASEFANQRMYPEIEHQINVAQHELRSRREDDLRFQERLAQQAGQTALAGGAGC